MIVFDASTLILVAKIDLLDLFLGEIRTMVTIPNTVERECCGFKKTLDAVIIRRALDASRITAVAVKNRRLLAKLQEDFGLGKGEAEAIALALHEKAALVGIDDKNGNNACKLLGLAFITALGILIRASEKGLLPGSEALEKLEALTKHGRYKDSIVEDARMKLEGRP